MTSVLLNRHEHYINMLRDFVATYHILVECAREAPLLQPLPNRAEIWLSGGYTAAESLLLATITMLVITKLLCKRDDLR